MPGCREKGLSRNYAFSQYDLDVHALAQESFLRGLEIYNKGRPPSVIITIP